MKTWSHAPSGGQLCGHCGALIAAGAPLLTVTSPSGAPWRLFRCASCAGESVPATIVDAVTVPPAPVQVPDLGHRPERVVPLRRPVPLAAIAKGLPFDARMAQTGERDDVTFEALGPNELPPTRERIVGEDDE